MGLGVTGVGFDGRSDVVLVEPSGGQRSAVLELRTVEDVFIEVGRASRPHGDNPRALANQIWRPEAVQRALSVWAEEVRPLASSMTFRVIVRVLHERSFVRTELRRAMTNAVSADRTKWRLADPAQVEVWMCEYQPGNFVADLRLTSASVRQHGGRPVERQGALRPTVAAAMVMLTGEPSGLLLDPCCGSGTILAEATTRGWRAVGLDVDASAVEIARVNVSEATVDVGDARELDLPDGAVSACVSNLPFGRQFTVQGSTSSWMRCVLTEIARVTRPRGGIVLLAPCIAQAPIPDQLRLTARYPITLLGTKTTIWVLDRQAN
ncbi:MAG TPA: methyltransferase domain-containing protein [Jiangellaceae bacterium]|nr:methyltransferase domain-containing protein [Jiangellaceae bacterium]